ncbi:2OG-Fe(II) oxygenase [Glacieibacterium frigidum]|uniref:Proline hydroxylase n=1 Tax=Glacieibacterium frigidum TaxID=2593303 RepID=A0A552U7K7_9SPHN|nr:2OG-Fe(II) oxygenase family protein [Glacieibacterium frigidum]TRW14203.1 proline hydroxylase [Glacieibacterium frigidum]
MTPAFDPRLDAATAHRVFAETGHVRLTPFLTDAVAATLHTQLRGREDWRQVVNSGDKVFELSRADRAAMKPEQLAALDAAVMAGAREGFQYRYETIRLPDGDAADIGEPLAAVTRSLSEGAGLAMLRQIVGAPIDFADGQATAYSPGDFLTGHDDAVSGKQRHAAYVMGLTPTWRVEWGGLLLFHEPGNKVTGVSPGYNSLDLFAVPRLHSVTQVTAAAAFRRYAVTGWLRSR